MTIEEELERLWLSLEHIIIDALITFPDRKRGIANWLRVASDKVEFGYFDAEVEATKAARRK